MSESDKSGKPELTAEDILRIEQQSKYEWPSQRAMFEKGAEWGILHERSAAQARIAELEDDCNVHVAVIENANANFRDQAKRIKELEAISKALIKTAKRLRLQLQKLRINF